MLIEVSALVRKASVCPFLSLSSLATEKKAGIRPECLCWLVWVQWTNSAPCWLRGILPGSQAEAGR